MRTARNLAVVLVALGAIAAVVAWGIVPRLHARTELREQTNTLAAPTVTVVHPKRSAPAEEVVLPGNIQPFLDAPIYARTSGYLRKWYFDIGAHVKGGQVLAEIESPEVDEQLRQARNSLDSARANLKLAQLTAVRYQDLFKTDSVAKQDVDNAVQSEAAQAATMKASQANVARLEQMVAFEKLSAPFDGVVTARNTDIGQLIQAGPSSTSTAAAPQTRELFHVAAISRLRVFVNVPQVYSHDTTPGMAADLTLPELPNSRFTGKLVRTANAFDPVNRTLLVEVDVDNKTGQLFPGAYTQVHFKMKTPSSRLLVPATILTFRSEGLRAAVVDGSNHASLVPVTLGRDYGNQIEITSGLSPESLVIVNPPDSLVNGELVRIVANHTGTVRPPAEVRTPQQ